MREGGREGVRERERVSSWDTICDSDDGPLLLALKLC